MNLPRLQNRILRGSKNFTYKIRLLYFNNKIFNIFISRDKPDVNVKLG